MDTVDRVVQIVEGNPELTIKSWGGNQKTFPLSWGMNEVPSSTVVRSASASMSVVRYKNVIVIFNNGQGFVVPHGTVTGRFIPTKGSIDDVKKVVVVMSLDSDFKDKSIQRREVRVYKRLNVIEKFMRLFSK